MPQNPTNSMRLRALIEHVVQTKSHVGKFCEQFERIFNNESDPSDFTDSERIIYAGLFDVVSWFSPYVEDRAEVPNYKDEDAVIEAAQKALSELRLR